MNTPMHSQLGNVRRGNSAVLSVTTCLAAALLLLPAAFAQDEPAKPREPASSAAATEDTPSGQRATPSGIQAPAAGQPSEAEMMQMMMEMGKLNENHKLLGQLAGTWSFVTKLWMAPGAPPSESKGTAVRKPVMEGRYYTMEVTGKIPMPGPDGKMKEMEFKGRSLEAYDNAKKKFVSTWSDNMSTGIMISEGTYDPASKTFTYTGDYEMAPGMKSKVRETVKLVDNDHHLFEFYEDRGGQETKTMEISYTRKK